MKIKELLHKNFDTLTDEEFKYIGKYFFNHPDKLKLKPKIELHKCYKCKHCIWWDNLGWTIWKCLKTDKEMTTKMVTHKRKCNLFLEDNILKDLKNI